MIVKKFPNLKKTKNFYFFDSQVVTSTFWRFLSQKHTKKKKGFAAIGQEN